MNTPMKISTMLFQKFFGLQQFNLEHTIHNIKMDIHIQLVSSPSANAGMQVLFQNATGCTINVYQQHAPTHKEPLGESDFTTCNSDIKEFCSDM